MILCLVTASGARPVATAMTPHLTSAHTYVDLNSISPARAVELGEQVTSTRARCVDGAIMAAVPRHGHRVPMMLAGAAASELAAEFGHLGMRIQVLPGEVGAASAVKMFRSLLAKGVEALMLEAVLGASQWARTRPFWPRWPTPCRATTGRRSRTTTSGGRSSTGPAAATRWTRWPERCVTGLTPHMTDAAAARIGWAAELGVGPALTPRSMGDYRTVIEALREAGAYGDAHPAAD